MCCFVYEHHMFTLALFFDRFTLISAVECVQYSFEMTWWGHCDVCLGSGCEGCPPNTWCVYVVQIGDGLLESLMECGGGDPAGPRVRSLMTCSNDKFMH